MEDIEIAAATALCAISYYNYVLTNHTRKSKKPWNRRRCWMTAIHRNRTRQTIESMFNELICEPSGEFDNFCCMTLTDFEELLCKISPMISKKNTKLRQAIPAKLRLAITLRFLASGDSYKSLHYLFKVSSQAISKIVPEVCAAINEVLKDEVKMPSTASEWTAIANGFNKNFPHCVGCVDGKHVVIDCPVNGGSEYYNYKNTFSIVLLALVDSNYRFIFADIGSQNGGNGEFFRNSLLFKKINNNNMNFPAAHPLPGRNYDVPYVFLGDGAFALSVNVMKPYPGNHPVGSNRRKFNQRLSRSRVVVENVFGQLTTVFRIFRKPFSLNPETVSLLTMTCILLHNFLRRSESSREKYTPPGTFDVYSENGMLVQAGSWRQVIQDSCAIRPLQHMSCKPVLTAVEVREEFATYFCNNDV